MAGHVHVRLCIWAPRGVKMGCVYLVFGERFEQKRDLFAQSYDPFVSCYKFLNSQSAGNELFISEFIQIKERAFGRSCPLIWSVLICHCEPLHPCSLSLGGPVSPASFTSIVCTWLPWLPLIYQKMEKEKPTFERFPPAAWGSYTQTRWSMSPSTRTHTANILPTLLLSSSVSLCPSAIVPDTLLQQCWTWLFGQK